MATVTPDDESHSKGNLVTIMHGAHAPGRKAESCQAWFQRCVGEDECVVLKIGGRKTEQTLPRSKVYRSEGASGLQLVTGNRIRGPALPRFAMRTIEKTAEVKVGANFKALKKEIQSLKGALKSQEATHENLMNAKASSSVRRHEREMASVKQDHKSERERMDLALSCTNKKNLRQENIIRHLEEG
jgi:hypothetical protein